MPLPTCLAWSARRCRRRCRGRTWSPCRGRSWGRGSWTGSWAAAAHTPAAGRSCSRSENITITSRKYLLEKQLLYYFPYFLAIYSVDATLELLVLVTELNCWTIALVAWWHCSTTATTLQPAVFPFPEDVHTTTTSITNHNQATVGGSFAPMIICIGCTGVWGPPPPYTSIQVPASILKGLFFILIRMDHSMDWWIKRM